VTSDGSYLAQGGYSWEASVQVESRVSLTAKENRAIPQGSRLWVSLAPQDLLRFTEKSVFSLTQHWLVKFPVTGLLKAGQKGGFEIKESILWVNLAIVRKDIGGVSLSTSTNRGHKKHLGALKQRLPADC
jgi:hypothetical protein